MKPRPNPSSSANAPVSKPTDWSAVAQWYDGLVGVEGSEYHRHVVHPGVLKLLGEVKAKRVLDVACGQGVLCRLLHERGAIVSGIDSAKPLIELARKHGPADIRYMTIDARDLAVLKSPEPFDAVTCVLALQNIDPIRPVFAGAAEKLAPGGVFVAVIMHPAFRAPEATSWDWDGDKVQYRRVERYLLRRKHPIVTNPGKKDGKYTWTFHRPITDYVAAARQAGMMVDSIEEWTSHKTSQPGKRAAAENSARKEIPMFMALRCVRTQM